jgi:hypothetical protein
MTNSPDILVSIGELPVALRGNTRTNNCGGCRGYTIRPIGHVIFEPEDFITRLAALVPAPRAHLMRYHGVFAPASAVRAQVVPSRRSGQRRAHRVTRAGSAAHSVGPPRSGRRRDSYARGVAPKSPQRSPEQARIDLRARDARLDSAIRSLAPAAPAPVCAGPP